MWHIQRMPFKVAGLHYYNNFFGRVYWHPVLSICVWDFVIGISVQPCTRLRILYCSLCYGVTCILTNMYLQAWAILNESIKWIPFDV